MVDRNRPAIGGIDGDMQRAAEEVRDVLGKYDWSGMNPSQHTDFTSKLYSVVQQSTDPKLQKNTARETESAR